MIANITMFHIKARCIKGTHYHNDARLTQVYSVIARTLINFFFKNVLISQEFAIEFQLSNDSLLRQIGMTDLNPP